MSMTRIIRLTCDGPICRPRKLAPISGDGYGALGGAYLTVEASSAVAARALAAEQGWSQDPRIKSDLCPSCTAAARPPAPAEQRAAG